MVPSILSWALLPSGRHLCEMPPHVFCLFSTWIFRGFYYGILRVPSLFQILVLCQISLQILFPQSIALFSPLFSWTSAEQKKFNFDEACITNFSFYGSFGIKLNNSMPSLRPGRLVWLVAFRRFFSSVFDSVPPL